MSLAKAPASKAAWLSQVVRVGRGRTVPRFYVLAATEWRTHRRDCLSRIQKYFLNEPVAVRSSKHDESVGAKGQAGRYRSFGPIDAARGSALTRAIDAVFASYGALHDADEVLVQIWVADATAMLGITSANATSFAGTASMSYYVGEGTSVTTAITAGWTNVQRFWLTQNATPSPRWPSAVRRAFALLATLETALKASALVLEVAVDRRGRLRVLQVTPSTCATPPTPSAVLETRWRKVARAYDQRAEPREAELGRRALFGLMPDWNPAELLGEHPRPLALSIFSELVTDHVWRDARINLGYRRSPVHPLLGVFAGRPYVDVRASLNSLIPSGIANELATKVIEASLDTLRRHPELHDRIETELQPTCIGFADEAARQLSDAGLGRMAQRSWRDALLAMEPMWRRFSAASHVGEHSASALQAIEARCQAGQSTADLMRTLRTIQQRFALPFAMHARLAFVARCQLSSLVTAGALSPKRHEFLLSCVSVIDSANGVNVGGAGVLRPATFDICVGPIQTSAIAKNRADSGSKIASVFGLSPREKRVVSLLIRPLHDGADADADAWIANALRRIEQRELWKYDLSHAVSNWLSAVTRWGQGRGVCADDLSYLTVNNWLNSNDRNRLNRQSASAKKRHDIEGTIKMPLLIFDRTDLRANIEPALRPTFQARGHARLSAAIWPVARHTKVHAIPVGAVVLIHAADPGFDWIFQYPFAVLVTCYGGPHSHMAVRSAELNVPCVLGCGETLYGALREAARVTIDFEQHHMSLD